MLSMLREVLVLSNVKGGSGAVHVKGGSGAVQC